MSNSCWRHVYDSSCNECVLEGKEASSRDACKGVMRSLLHEMAALLREQRDMLKEIA